jgi:hypothetical protein
VGVTLILAVVVGGADLLLARSAGRDLWLGLAAFVGLGVAVAAWDAMTDAFES